MAVSMYHERQHLQHCLKHTLNNLFQRQLYSCAELDGICSQLAPGALSLLNPHRTFLLGNYDVNVLEVGLAQQDKELVWYDLRDTQFEKLQLEGCWAVVVNVRSSGPLSWVLRGRHWFGLRPLGNEGRWYNLDSRLRAPQLVDLEGLGDAAAVRRFLALQLEHHDAKVFLVREAAAAGAAAAGAAAAGGAPGAAEAAAGREAGGGLDNGRGAPHSH